MSGRESDFQQNEYILSKLKNFEQVRHLADEMPGGFFIYRADGNEDILYANDAMLRIFGCDNMKEFREWTGNSFRGIVHPDDLEAVEESIAEQIRNSRYDLDYVEYRIIRRDGEVRWVDDYGHFLENDGCGIFYVFIGDATEKKNRLMEERLTWKQESLQREEKWKNRAEVYSRELEEALEQAKAANAAKNTFLANMSHDLRTPMNAIMGFAQLARQHREDPEKVRGCMDGIEESGKLLLQLFDDVLEITKIESEQVRIEETEGNLEEIVGKVREDANARALAKGISLSCSLSGVRHFDIFADEKKLSQVLSHLLFNAVKYTRQGGNIWITVEEVRQLSGDYAIYRFVVEDTGIGIGEDFLPHIFEPFEREKNTTMSGVQGTGLGLAITKNIIDRMGGTIEVDSAAGEGSRFTVTLSFRLNHSQGREQERRESTLDRLRKGQKILLVEDNEINREIEVELLRCAGFFVDTASDGNMAANAVRNSLPGEYALVLMDIQMPVVDGYQAARLIRSIPDPELSAIPIVALSANAFDEDRRQSIRSGMNAHMAKPVNMPRLIELLEEI